MLFVLVSVFAVLMAYLVGGIPFGVIFARLKGVDIRKVGSGNVGAANVVRALGRRWGIAVFLLDMLKGLGPCLASRTVLLQAGEICKCQVAVVNAVWLGVGLAAILGHNYSPFLRFRGGKGVSTSFGVTLGIYPQFTLPALCGLVVWAIALLVSRMSALGSLLGGVFFPVTYYIYARYRGVSMLEEWPFLSFAILVSLMLVVRHRANILRLVSGTEARFGQPPTPPGDEGEPDVSPAASDAQRQ
jgi:glycerol-3-phosphate acyltransferase PlsY